MKLSTEEKIANLHKAIEEAERWFAEETITYDERKALMQTYIRRLAEIKRKF